MSFSSLFRDFNRDDKMSLVQLHSSSYNLDGSSAAAAAVDSIQCQILLRCWATIFRVASLSLPHFLLELPWKFECLLEKRPGNHGRISGLEQHLVSRCVALSSISTWSCCCFRTASGRRRRRRRVKMPAFLQQRSRREIIGCHVCQQLLYHASILNKSQKRS